MSQRKALLVGINYLKTDLALAGCINDAMNIQNLLRKMYGSNIQIHFLKETDKNPNNHPTKKNMLREFNWLLDGAKPGDSLFFHYSGHGGSVRDNNGDEKDRMDETLVPLDFRRVGQMRDDELKQVLIDKVPSQVKLTCLIDCCHSGTILDLKYGYIQPQNGSTKSVIHNKSETQGDIVLFSGCKDSQYSWEVFDQRKIQGAMTNAFVKAMTELREPLSQQINRQQKNIKVKLKQYRSALIRNKRNKRLVRKNKQSIKFLLNRYKTLAKRAQTTTKESPEDIENRITYSALIKTLLSHLKKGGNTQDPQISSGRRLTLTDKLSL